MATLLTLPREVRNLIYGCVLQTPAPTTSRVAENEDGRRLFDNKNYIAPHDELLWTESKDRLYQIASISLLCTNKQIKQEVKDEIHHLRKALTYRIDIALVNEQKLELTWIHIPARLKVVPVVTVCIYARDSRLDRGVVTKLADSGDGSPIAWALCHVLCEFVLFGPNFKPRPESLAGKKPRKSQYALEELDIEIGDSIPDEAPDPEISETPDRIADGAEEGERWNRLISPETLAKHFIGAIEGMCRSCSDHSYVFEAVGSIALCVEGVKRMTWDLQELLDDEILFCRRSITRHIIRRHRAKMFREYDKPERRRRK